MTLSHSDTIVAPITGQGPAAVAVVRLSGPRSFEIASKIFRPWTEPIRARYALVGNYHFGESGVALPFEVGSSFTGDEVVELSVHGGRASIEGLVGACVREGARLALPGEFSLRAFLNGKIDLSQAEAIADMVEAETERQLRLANLNLGGGLRNQVESLIEELTQELAHIEATIDFAEEIGDYDFDVATDHFRAILARLEELRDRGGIAHLSRRGIRIAILGRPNAGKSSLLNAILGIDRSIVTPIAGTTRDTIEEQVDWDGLKAVLIDTAGLREGGEQIEEIGISRSFLAAGGAEEVLYLFDAQVGWTEEDEAALTKIGRPVTVIGNKADLSNPDRGLPISAASGLGLNVLRKTIAQRYTEQGDFFPTNERQSDHLGLAILSIQAVLQALSTDSPIDLIGVLVREAIDELGRVIGLTTSESILDEIFSRFCIGK